MAISNTHGCTVRHRQLCLSLCDRYRPFPPGCSFVTLPAFLRVAASLGYRRVLLCENLRIELLPDEELIEIRSLSEQLGLTLETRYAEPDSEPPLTTICASCRKSVPGFCALSSAPSLPTVIRTRDGTSRNASALLREVLPYCAREGIRIGLENHYDLDTPHLVRIAEEVNSPHLGHHFRYDKRSGIHRKAGRHVGADRKAVVFRPHQGLHQQEDGNRLYPFRSSPLETALWMFPA